MKRNALASMCTTALALSLALAFAAALAGCSGTVQQSASEPEVPVPGATGTNAMQEDAESNEASLVPKFSYELSESHEVFGRQGVASDGESYWVSGSTTLTRYDKSWNEIARNESPFEDFDKNDKVNHIGDIDCYDGKIYCGVEYFMDGAAENFKMVVYDAETLKQEAAFALDPASGQTEVCGACINYDQNVIASVDWLPDATGRYIYEYNLDGSFVRKIHLQPSPENIQGIAYFDGSYYITADDGDVNNLEADHVYRVDYQAGTSNAAVALERTLSDMSFHGEIEGLFFDSKNKQLLVHSNHGAYIVAGMPSGFYEGFDKEISEVYVYDIKKK